MEIVLVTAEIAPYSHFTSVGESAAALPKALRALGHKVTVVSPLWTSIDPASKHLARRLYKIEVEVDGQKRSFVPYEGRSSGGVELCFLSEPTLFPASADPQGVGHEGAVRWGGFVRAVGNWLARRETRTDVVHILGWQAASLPILLRDHGAFAHTSTVLGIHDAAQQGLFDRAELSTFGIPEALWGIDGVEFYGQLSTLKAGIQTASRVVASSPSYARSLLENANGLDGVLRARGKAFLGILEGVDASVWNSATDPWLESRFDAMDVAGAGRFGKHRCKTALQKELGLPVRDDAPLLSLLGNLSSTRGYDAVPELLTALVRNDVQIVVVASEGSDPALISNLTQTAARWPDRFAVRESGDLGAIHRALGASDLLLLPGEHEATGVRAMQAHRYGVLPIARRTGAFADAIVDCDPKLTSGTGFLWVDAEGALGAAQRAIAAFQSRAAFRAIAHRAMLVDHGWERTARMYERMYKNAASASEPQSVSAS